MWEAELRLSRRRRRRRWLVVLFLWMLGASLGLVPSPSPARAELPSIRFDRLTPLGGAAGSTAVVEIAGADIDGVASLLFDHPGFASEPTPGKERQFKISVAADVPAGTYDVRLVGRFGVSNPRLFAVGRDLPDVAEVEPNNSAEKAQAIPHHAAIHGSSDGNDQDVYRVTLKKSQRITVQCQAGRLDGMLDSNLSLSSAAGVVLAANGDYHGRDAFLDFVAPDDGEYLITVNDLSYRGGHPYRLVVSDRPQIENVSPRAVQAGVATDLEWLGRNLGAGAEASPLRLADLPLERRSTRIVPPAELLAGRAYRFFDHPTDHATLPTAATCTVAGFQAAYGGDGQATSRIDVGSAASLLLTDKPVTLDAEPNDDREKPQPLTLPAVVSGRFDSPRDADWFELKTGAAGAYSVEVYCERIGGRADPFVAVVDDQGKRVGELDDFGHRVNAFDGHLRDPSGSFNLAADRVYRLLVQDRYGRGGARYQYVLTVGPSEPDFFVASMHGQNPGPGGLTVRPGGAARLDLIANLQGGFSGPITVVAENLPPGLHVAPTTFVGTSSSLVVWADKEAAEWTGFIDLVATGRRGDETLRREVRPYTRVWSDPGMNSSRPSRRLAVAVRESAPFGLELQPARAAVEAGKKVELKLKLTRHWPDFRAKVNVLAQSFPAPFKMANTELAEGQTEIVVSIETQANARPGDYTLSVVGQAQTPYAKDPAATTRPNTLVSTPSTPVTLTVLEAPKAPPKAPPQKK